VGASPTARPQPSQKRFDTLLWQALCALDPARPVFVESESRRIGALQLPDALLSRMHRGRRLTLVTPLAQRVTLLKQDYAHFVTDAKRFRERMTPLAPLHGKATLARWEGFAAAGEWDILITELLERHYDPTYARSLERFVTAGRPEQRIDVKDASAEGFAALARDLLGDLEAREAIGVGAP